MKAVTMKTVALVAPCVALITSMCGSLAASPAATQSWVKNYVATNSAPSASVSNAVRRSEIVMAGSTSTVMQILEGDASTNAVRKAADAAVNTMTPIVNMILEGGVR